MFIAPERGPQTLKSRPWAGARLSALPGVDAAPGALLGESWEFSTLEGSESLARGVPLSNLLGRPLSFLAKLIDTATPLSLQVHPRDDVQNGTPGKEEAWIVLDAAPDAFVLAGLAPSVSPGDFETRVRAAAADPAEGDALLECFVRLRARPGMVILVPGGTAHAIGGGILLAEIQQPTDCTYRFFDYGSERPIHPDQALSALVHDARPRTWVPTEGPKNLAGDHLELAPLLAGGHDVTANGGDVLLVPVHDGVEVRVDGETHNLARGDLRLLTEGSHMRVTVPERGVAVLGALP